MFRWGIHLVGRRYIDVSDDEKRFAYVNMKHVYERYLENREYTIVVEGLFTWNDRISCQGSALELVNLAVDYGFTCRSIVLQATKSVLESRNASRTYAVPAEEFNELYNNVYREVGPDETVIDSTNQKVNETLHELALRSKLKLPT